MFRKKGAAKYAGSAARLEQCGRPCCYRWSNSLMASYSVCAPTANCSLVAHSSGQWLRPSRQGMKIMPAGQDPDPRGAVRPAFSTACPPPLSCSRGPRPWTDRGKRHVVRRPPERVRQTPPTSRDRAESPAWTSPARIEPPARRRQTGTRTRATRGLSHAAWPTPRSCSLSHWTTLASGRILDLGRSNKRR